MEEYLIHFAGFIGKDRWSVFSEENSRHSVGHRISQRCKEVTAQVRKDSKLRRSRVVDPSHKGCRIYSWIGISRFRGLKLQNIVTGVAILRYTISQRQVESCGATGVGDVDRWYASSGFRSEKSRTLDIRIRDPAKSEILIEVTGR
jgi:hypothetical protein